MNTSNNMMYKPEDEAIIYNGKLQQVKLLIEDLKELGLNVESAKEEVKQIEEMVSGNVEHNYNTYNDTTSLLNSALCFDYNSAIKRLDILNTFLQEEWKDYYVIVNKCNAINKSISNVEELDFDQIVDSLINILDLMRASTTISYDIEKDIVERLYELIYTVIKLEIIYNKSNKLLDSIKNNETDSIYITNLLKKEIKETKNDEVDRLVSSLKSNGMDSKYLLDKKLIMLVSAINEPEIINELMDEYKENNKRIEEARKDNKNYNDTLKDINYNLNNSIENKENIKKRYKIKMIKTTIKAILLSLVLSGGIITIKNHGFDDAYNTEVTTYDSTTDETTVTNEYTTGRDNKITVVEKTPWRQPEFFDNNKYRREEYIYEVPEEVYKSCKEPKDLLNKDINNQIIPKDYKTKEKSEKPEDFEYRENIFTITAHKKDLNDSKKVINNFNTIITSLITLSLLLLIQQLFMHLVDKDTFKDIKKYKINNIDDINTNKNRIDKITKNININNEKIEELKKLLDEELEVLETISKAEPEVSKQLKKIKGKN